MTTKLIDVAGALLKKGSYRSAHLYLQMMKRVHIEEGHSWSEALELAMKDAIRSCLRGKGPDKSCPSMDMRQLASISELDPIPGGPQRPRDTVILFAHFACREIEAALRIRSQIAVVPSEENCGVVSMFLPASKVDPKGCGVLRRLGCSCKTSPELCPVAAASRIIENNDKHGGPPSDPFLYTGKEGVAPTKATMIACFRAVAGAVGAKPSRDTLCVALEPNTLPGLEWSTTRFSCSADGEVTQSSSTFGMFPWKVLRNGSIRLLKDGISQLKKSAIKPPPM